MQLFQKQTFVEVLKNIACTKKFPKNFVKLIIIFIIIIYLFKVDLIYNNFVYNKYNKKQPEAN